LNKKSVDNNLTSISNSWKFNNKVAKTFDIHVNKSIPHYSDIQKYAVSLSEWFLQENSRIYDLGCSTGETIKLIGELKLNNNIEVIAIDQSRKMLEIAKNKNKKVNNKKNLNISYKKKDLTKIISFKKSNLIISILTLPFLNYAQRKSLIVKIFKSLNKGGAFIFVDKIRASNSVFEDTFNQVYFDFKHKKGFNSEQVFNKSKMLRSSMNLKTIDDIKIELTKTGFKKNEIFFKWFNFVGLIAIK
tara:strand:- start:1439 stop:2173 length:735 start_codon:yes stop_codon:yes gene_type:complete